MELLPTGFERLCEMIFMWKELILYTLEIGFF